MVHFSPASLGELDRDGCAQPEPSSRRHERRRRGALLRKGPYRLDKVAAETGLRLREYCALLSLFAHRHEKIVTVYSAGRETSPRRDPTRSTRSSECISLTGRSAGRGWDPVTGQPNAMGGREVGGLANMLAAHMEIGRPGRCAITCSVSGMRRRSAAEAGHQPMKCFSAVADGRVKAIWIMGTDHRRLDAEADLVEAALGEPLPVLVSECASRRRAPLRHAHVKLPAAAWARQSITDSDKRSRQQPFFRCRARRGPN